MASAITIWLILVVVTILVFVASKANQCINCKSRDIKLNGDSGPICWNCCRKADTANKLD